jgi:hypothetical protein
VPTHPNPKNVTRRRRRIAEVRGELKKPCTNSIGIKVGMAIVKCSVELVPEKAAILRKPIGASGKPDITIRNIILESIH